MSRFHLVLSCLITAAMLCLVVLAANIAHSAECNTVDMVKTKAAALPGAKLVEMGADETRGFLIAYNAEPPPSSVIGDYILAIDWPNWPGIFIIVFEKGCAEPEGLKVSRDLFKRLLAAI